jgi:hypothetical protein
MQVADAHVYVSFGSSEQFINSHVYVSFGSSEQFVNYIVQLLAQYYRFVVDCSTMHCVFYIRGTFIESGPESGKTLCPNRSHSAPPSKVHINRRVPKGTSDSEQIASWMERASHLSAQQSSTPGGRVRFDFLDLGAAKSAFQRWWS